MAKRSSWWTGPGQARARLPDNYAAPVPRVPVVGGSPGDDSGFPEQWSSTSTFAAGTDGQLLQLNLPAQADHVLVWSENSGAGAGRITVTERVPFGDKVLSFDVGPGGGNQALVRGSVTIDFAATVNTILSVWVYQGDVLDRAPIQNIVSVADDGAGNPGVWTDLSPGLGPAAQGWPPKDRNNLMLMGESQFDVRWVDLAGNPIGFVPNQRILNIYHPPIARLQVRNPGGPPTPINVAATWRRTA